MLSTKYQTELLISKIKAYFSCHLLHPKHQVPHLEVHEQSPLLERRHEAAGLGYVDVTNYEQSATHDYSRYR